MRRIVGVKRIDKRRMDEQKLEVGVKERLKKILARFRLTWAGQLEIMGDGKLTKMHRRCRGERMPGRPKLH